MDVLLPLFQLLYFVAHFLFSLLQAVYDTLIDVQLTIVFLYRWITRSSTKLRVQGNIFSKGKLPVHPAVAFLPGEYNVSQLPQLVSVLAALAGAGVQHLSAHDPSGKLEEQKEEVLRLLQEALSSSYVQLVQHPASKLHSAHTLQDNIRQRGVASDSDVPQSSKSSVLLSITSCESDMAHLTSCVRRICSHTDENFDNLELQDLHSILSCRQIVPSKADCEDRSLSFGRTISNKLTTDEDSSNKLNDSHLYEVNESRVEYYNQPDPDLMLVVGDYVSSGGYSPWSLRLAEFTRISKLSRLDSTELTNILYRYAKIEQRYGR